MKKTLSFLKVKKGAILDKNNNPVILKGLNLGGWLMMEGYILGGRNIAEQEFKRNFLKIYGKKGLEEFERLFYGNFIREEDFKIIKGLNFNCVRIPFNYRILEDEKKFRYLKRAIKFCKKYNLWAILDMHAAPGSQNEDWHSDSEGKALLWKEKKYQYKFISLWEKLSFFFKDEEIIAGYDILNEPVCKDSNLLLEVYKNTVNAIRKIDRNHIIFLEGNYWAQDIDFLGKPWQENLVYSIHFYAPLEFTFGFVPNLRYPGKLFGKFWSKKTLKGLIFKYYKIKERYSVPIFVGEFGQNNRCPFCHKEFNWTKDILDIFKEFSFNWCWWTYKAVANRVFPDGIYQYQENPLWINRSGNVFGWETYFKLWRRYKKEIISSWKTEKFILSKHLIKILS
jgi:aryl-phospho-beta-D-glucosidase BglC (GH1 family)